MYEDQLELFSTLRLFAVGALLFILCLGGIIWLFAVQEAAAYRSVTGLQVTAWDAVWLELRVQAPPDSTNK